MTPLMQQMREELVRRNYAATTIHTYLKAVEHFRQHVGLPLDQLGPDDIRRYHAHLLGERKLAVNTVVLNICALRFLYIRVMKRRDMKEDLPYPKQRLQLPVILSPAEVAQLISAASNLYHRAILMTLYATGLRRSELCRLKVNDIDSQRMMIRVSQVKGGIDREVPLSRKLLPTLREYYRWMRPQTYLFSGTVDNWRADKPISPKVVWQAVRHCVCQHRIVLAEDLSRRNRVKAERFAEGLWPLAYHYLSRGGKYVDTERARRDGGAHPRGFLSFISCSSLCLKVGRVLIQSLVWGRALTVFQVGALPGLDNVTVGIADVAANLAVLGYRLCDKLRSATCP